MSGKKIGYIRVSTTQQNPERQLEGIKLDKKFIDRCSGSTTDRPQLKLMLEYIREDDHIFVHSMDRLARNLLDLKKLVNELVLKGISVTFEKENLTFSGKDDSMSNLMLNLLGSFAEFELAFIRERQLEGIRIAKMKGKYKGRKKIFDFSMAQKIEAAMKTRKTKTEIAKEIGISRPSLYRFINEMREKNVV